MLLFSNTCLLKGQMHMNLTNIMLSKRGHIQNGTYLLEVQKQAKSTAGVKTAITMICLNAVYAWTSKGFIKMF